MFAATDDTPAPSETVSQSVSKQLTAAELLKSDIDPKVDALKDILFVLKLYPDYADKRDYISIRQSLVLFQLEIICIFFLGIIRLICTYF